MAGQDLWDSLFRDQGGFHTGKVSEMELDLAVWINRRGMHFRNI